MRAQPQDRVTAPVDVQDRVALTGHVHPMARDEFQVGPTPADHRMENMMLVLRPDATQEQALEALIRAQHDPSSPLHHKWLTPEMYAEHFGISASDVASTTGWLKSHGMVIEQVVNGGRQILFSGTAVEAAFNTSMRSYQVAGELHHANAIDPEIPRVLSSVVSGVVSLHDFRAQAASIRVERPDPGNTWYYNGIQQSRLVPGDLAKLPQCKTPAGRENTYSVWHEIELNPGDQYTLLPDTLHWFQAGDEGAVVSEFSTRSRDESDIFTDPQIQRATRVV